MLELTVRLIASLAVVIGLLLVIARLGARKLRGSAGAAVQVLHRQPLSRTTAVAVVAVGERVLVLGTTEQQVSVLAELDPGELEEAQGATLAVLPAPAVPDAQAGKPVGSHRAAPKAGRRAQPRAAGPLAGSVLSPATWKQAITAATGRAS